MRAVGAYFAHRIPGQTAETPLFFAKYHPFLSWRFGWSDQISNIWEICLENIMLF